jgi:hypothetical protein
MYHDGPATAYLSKAPGERQLNDYAGGGDWYVHSRHIVILSILYDPELTMLVVGSRSQPSQPRTGYTGTMESTQK